MAPTSILLVVVLVGSFFLCYGLKFSLARLKSSWKSCLGWEAVPALQLISLLLLLLGVNWAYEAKLFAHRTGDGFFDSHTGPILLATAFAMVAIASGLLGVLRMLRPRLFGTASKWYFWVLAAILALGISLLTLGGDALVILGPSAITLRDQMDAVPD